MCWLQQSAQLWHYPTFLLVPLMVIACIECFAGYRAWRFLIGFNGAVLGFVGGAVLCVMAGAPMLVLVGAFVGTVAGAVLFAWVVPLGSFVFVLGSVVSLTMLLGHAVRLHSLAGLRRSDGMGGVPRPGDDRPADPVRDRAEDPSGTGHRG
jgi:hypothetical protein